MAAEWTGMYIYFSNNVFIFFKCLSGEIHVCITFCANQDLYKKYFVK